MVAASSFSNYIHTTKTDPKTGLSINRYPKTLSIVNNTGSKKTFKIINGLVRGGPLYTIENGESWKYGVNPEGVKDMIIGSYDDVFVNFTFPCVSSSCSSSDSVASCKANISKSYKSSVRLNTYENEKKVFTADVFVVPDHPESNKCDITSYEKLKGSVKEINIPYTDKTAYELVFY